MKIPQQDQTISTRAIALLVGEQQGSIDVHGAGQEGARLSLTWGTLLLGFTALDQVDALRQAFADSQSAARQTPERLDPKILSAAIGDRHEHRANRLRMRNQAGRCASPSGLVLCSSPRRTARVLPSPPRWALSVAGARRCVPLARCSLPGAMPADGGY